MAIYIGLKRIAKADALHKYRFFKADGTAVSSWLMLLQEISCS